MLTELEEKHKELRKATRGIVLFGTPHEGFNMKDLQDMILDDLVDGGNHPQASLLESIKSHGGALIEQTRRLKSIIANPKRHIRVVSCYETEETREVIKVRRRSERLLIVY